LQSVRGGLPGQEQEQANRKAINMALKEPVLEAEQANIGFFETLPEVDRGRVDFSTVRGVQFLPPLFEFSGACSGCGETPYIKLLSQLFGDRLLVANATGCSSIYGGNLPTTPWSVNSEGRGPAWSNSLFEDNAEFGLGFRLTADMHLIYAKELLRALASGIGQDLVDDLIEASSSPRSISAASVAGWPNSSSGCGRSRTRAPRNCWPSPISWSGAASGSSAATAGPTTLARPASITSWPVAAT